MTASRQPPAAGRVSADPGRRPSPLDAFCPDIRCTLDIGLPRAPAPFMTSPPLGMPLYTVDSSPVRVQTPGCVRPLWTGSGVRRGSLRARPGSPRPRARSPRGARCRSPRRRVAAPQPPARRAVDDHLAAPPRRPRRDGQFVGDEVGGADLALGRTAAATGCATATRVSHGRSCRGWLHRAPDARRLPGGRSGSSLVASNSRRSTTPSGDKSER